MSEEIVCPIWVTKRHGRGSKPTREICGGHAALYEVKGESYSVHQVMCFKHAEKSRNEGFVLKELKPETAAR